MRFARSARLFATVALAGACALLSGLWPGWLGDLRADYDLTYLINLQVVDQTGVLRTRVVSITYDPLLTIRPLQVVVGGTGRGTVTSGPPGISCGAVCTAPFHTGDTVTLSATPDPGFLFDGWNGECSGTGACVLSMGTPRAVAATFSQPPSFTVNVQKGGTGAGTVTSTPGGIGCGATCSALFVRGTSVTLTAAAVSGSRFLGWSGACSGTGSCTISVGGDATAVASFSDAVKEFVAGFYQEVLGRSPAASEVIPWADFLRADPTSVSASAFAHGFLDGPEFLSRRVTLATFVTLLYNVFLQRAPDPPGLGGWVTQLQGQFDSALPGFVNSPEFRSLLPDLHDSTGVAVVVHRLYQQVLGRSPAGAEAAAWVDYITRTGDILGVAQGFFASDEYNGTARTLAEHVIILYRTFLGRTPAASEVTPWVNFLESFRIAVEDAFIASPEFQTHFASLFH